MSNWYFRLFVQIGDQIVAVNGKNIMKLRYSEVSKICLFVCFCFFFIQKYLHHIQLNDQLKQPRKSKNVKYVAEIQARLVSLRDQGLSYCEFNLHKETLKAGQLRVGYLQAVQLTLKSFRAQGIPSIRSCSLVTKSIQPTFFMAKQGPYETTTATTTGTSKQQQQQQQQQRFFVHFFAAPAQLRREMTKF